MGARAPLFTRNLKKSIILFGYNLKEFVSLSQIITIKSNIMTITTQQALSNFKFWGGAKDHNFTYSERDQLEIIIEDYYQETRRDTPPTATEINDLFWFEAEQLCEWIGLDFEEYENR